MKKTILALFIISFIFVFGCAQEINDINLFDTNQSQNINNSTNNSSQVTFEHSTYSGLETKDCFDEICVTRDTMGPVIIQGEANWICGACYSGGKEYVSMDKNFQQNCVRSRMLNLVGKPLCLITKTNKWDLVFNSYAGGFESGEFSYTRVIYNE